MKNPIKAAQKQFELGWPEKALELLSEVKTSPQSDELSQQIAIEQAKFYQALGQNRKAIETLNVVKNLDAQVYYLIGILQTKEENWREAIRMLEKANDMESEDPVILTALGWALYCGGEKIRGRKVMQQGLRLNSAYIESLLKMAAVYVMDEKPLHAMACAKRANQLSRSSDETEVALNLYEELFETHGKIQSQPLSKKLDVTWNEFISVADHPSNIIQKAMTIFEPSSELEVHMLAERIMTLWNSLPRPELGGMSPSEAVKHVPRQSSIEQTVLPHWISLDRALAEEVSLRKNMVVYLTYLSENSCKTTSRGNLPLKEMRAINALFDEPQELDTKIGDMEFKVRSSADIWAFDFLNALAELNKLAKFPPGKKITLTKTGQDFLRAAPNYQVWTLLNTWWWQMNWQYAFKWRAFDDKVMHFLPSMALEVLKSLEQNRWINLDEFATKFITRGALMDFAEVENPRVLKNAIKKMIILIPTEFGCFDIKYESEEKAQSYRYLNPIEFKLTSFGRALFRRL